MDDIIKKKFGEQIKNLRKTKKYTQEQLAENIKINPRQMARIEAGESFVTSQTIYRLCMFFKIQPKNLFDFDIDSKKHKNDFLDDLIRKLCIISDDKEKLEFIGLAIDSLRDKTSLNKLKLVLKGIELSL